MHIKIYLLYLNVSVKICEKGREKIDITIVIKLSIFIVEGKKKKEKLNLIPFCLI